MRRRVHVLTRVVAFLLIAASYASMAGATGSRNRAACVDQAIGGCTGPSFCSMAWAEAGCASQDYASSWHCGDNGTGPCCHANGYDCANWPFNGCGYGEVKVTYYCYGEY